MGRENSTGWWLNKNAITDNVGKRIKETGIKDEKMLQALDKIGESAFEFDIEASKGCPGLWSHTSVRKDKMDIFPQVEMVQMIISL